jgi:hypothetical protein
MKVVERRLRNLESSFHSALQSIKEAADPFSDQTLVNLLAAGEWEYVMTLLDCKRRGAGPAHLPPMPSFERLPMFDLSDPTCIRQIMDVSLAHLTEEQRYALGAAILDADPDKTLPARVPCAPERTMKKRWEILPRLYAHRKL